MKDFLTYESLRFRQNKPEPAEDILAVEESLQIVLNGGPFTVTMRTPGDDDALVHGILFTENVYRGFPDYPILYDLPNSLGIPTRAKLKLSSELLNLSVKNERNILSVSSCGVCGKKELDHDWENEDAIMRHDKLSPELIYGCFQQMEENQTNFSASGGVHASAAFNISGNLLAAAEDIGRHNAVEKVCGKLHIHQHMGQASLLLVSGRVSYEIVAKCFAMGIPVLAAVSAPSSMAVDMAKSMGITLIAFSRHERFTVYSHPGRIF